MRQFAVRLTEDGSWARLATALVVIILLEAQPVPLPFIESYATAREALRAEDNAAAGLAYHQALDYQAWQTWLLSDAGQAEFLAGDDQAAIEDLTTLAGARPLTPDEHLILGHAFANQGKMEEAQSEWLLAFEAGLADTDAYLTLIEWHLSLQDWDAAAALLSELAQLNADDAAARYRLGLVLALSDPPQALTHLDEAAQLEHVLGNQIAPVKSLLANQSSYDPAFFKGQLGILYVELEEWSLAEAAFAQAIAFNPAYGEAMAYLGYARAQQGRVQEALPALQQAAAISPESPAVHYLTGLYWKQRQSWLEARAAFERAYDIDITNPGLAVEIANTHRAENTALWAEIWLLEALRLAEDDERILIALAQFYVDDEYLVETAGISTARQAVEAAPNNGAAHDALGWAYFLLGELPAAQAEIETALLLDPSLIRAYVHLGTLLELRSQREAAIESYLIAYQLEPEGAFGIRALRALERLGAAPSN